ncbi:MAG TPA: amylo-alpha-1,6-glucosidase [Usitatibacter sp.]|nr:amylo-alpha-1,6-glucosidase [Usitatibacter sp.]
MKDRTPLEDAIRVGDRWYVLATSSREGDPVRVLKYGESFALFDRFGDMPRAGSGEHGLYHQGTRFLSRYELRVNGQRPILLHSSARRDNSALGVDGTNPDLQEDGRLTVKGMVHVARNWALLEATCHERVRIANYGQERVRLRLAFDFAADYADIFEVRGYDRSRRGADLPAQVERERVTLAYRGLDRVERRTAIEFSRPPARLAADRAEFLLDLAPRERFEMDVRIACDPADEARSAGYAGAARLVEEKLRRGRGASAQSMNEQFDDWMERSAADITMLTAGNPQGCFPYAGVPWYSVPFGRDGILTALQYLWAEPGMARDVLRFLAGTQATEVRPEQDAEPGKIVHEMRKGELANLGEIPFGRYYGTIDATPLFVVLAGEYHWRTGDDATLEAIWPNVERALEWMDRYGDRDGDGYIEYERRSERGLVNQGWKDSEDSVFHADGRLAEGPIALCEVQGYAYLARVHAARLAHALGHAERAAALERRARELQASFERDFWCEDLGTYALALDGAKRPCRVRTSNAGHVLWSGIARPDRARRVGETLLAPDSFSGWGVRTVARGEARYNPMSYHNGSVWPHDNAIVAMGLARYGMKEKSVRIASALYDASLFMDLHRLPELYCGFERVHAGEGPTLYPVACSPQAWAAASAFYLVKACLGLSFRPDEPRIRFLHPMLPGFLERLRLVDVRVGDAVVDVQFERNGKEVGVNVMRKQGEIEVSVVL